MWLPASGRRRYKASCWWRRGIGPSAAAVTHGKPRGLRGAAQRGLADVGGMGVSGHFAAHRAQPETLGGIVAGGLEPPVIKHQRFGAAPLEKQFAVIRPGVASRSMVRAVSRSSRPRKGKRGAAHGVFLSLKAKICKSRLNDATQSLSCASEYDCKRQDTTGWCRMFGQMPNRTPLVRQIRTYMKHLLSLSGFWPVWPYARPQDNCV